MGKLKRGFLRLFNSIVNMLQALLGVKSDILFSELLADGKKIIQLDMKDTLFWEKIRESSASFLGIAEPNVIKRVKKETNDQKLMNRIFSIEEYPNPYKNNADILVLSGDSYQSLIEHKNFLHCHYVLIERKLYLKYYRKLFKPLLKHTLWLRMKYIGSIKEGQSNEKFMVLKVIEPKKTGATKFLSPITGVTAFFQLLNEKNVNYVVLRWFEALPFIKPGADIDILVQDEDAERVEAILNQEPGLIETDVYSVTGIPGFGFHGMANYPPYLAKEILKDSILYKGVYKIPNQEKHFLSFVYHAVYHKGLKSGIRTKSKHVSSFENPKHDYSTEIKRMAEKTDFCSELTLEDLHDYLEAKDWAPPKDTLTKLAGRNGWIKDKLTNKEKGGEVGLVTFILRERALELEKHEQIQAEIKNYGFDILYTKKLTEEEKENVSKRIRGGNWGPGPYESSGGKPALILIAYDLLPQRPTRAQLDRHPAVDNANVFIKNKIRSQINQSLPVKMQCNMIHSSDNYAEALDYIAAAAPEYLGDKLNSTIVELKNNFYIRQDHEVIRTMTKHGHRAKVELIKYNKEFAVKKTYKANFLEYCQREIYVMNNFAGKIEGVPELLESGDNYFIVPYYEDSLNFRKNQPNLLPLTVSKKAMSILKSFYDHDLALIDFNPGNIIYDKDKGVKVIDFEFLYRYKENEKPGTFENCFDLAGVPENFTGNLPKLNNIYSRNYGNAWKKYVGLNLDSLLHDSYPVQVLKRQIFIIRLLPRKNLEKFYSILAGKYGRVMTRIRGLIS